MLLELVPNHHNGRAASSARTRKEAGSWRRAERNSIWILLCPPMAPELLLSENGDFGRSPIYGQLSATHYLRLYVGVPDVKHNRGQEIKH